MIKEELSYFFTGMKNCLNEFYMLYGKEGYVCKKEYGLFLDKYKDIIEQLLNNNDYFDTIEYQKLVYLNNNIDAIFKTRNDKHITEKLMEYKEYFDNMFMEVDPKIILDEEQRKAVLIDEDYSLVVAGAGSGKTTTMAAKVRYLVEKCNVNPKEIILLAFTNKAVEELDERINGTFKLNVEVLTFHKLGMKFIRRLFDNPVQIIGEATGYLIISECVKKFIFPNKDVLRQMQNSFAKQLSFDEAIFEYKNFNEYFKYYVDKKYEEVKYDLSNYNQGRIDSRRSLLRTIKNEQVKSLPEVNIANFLFANGIDYEYEKLYPHHVEDRRSYSPDFTIRDFDRTIYIEFYGMESSLGNGKYSVDEIKFYKKMIDKKRIIHTKYKTDLIEIYFTSEDGRNYLEILKDELEKRLISFNKKSDTEIFQTIMYSSQDVHIFKFVNLVLDFINKFKNLNYSIQDFEYLKKKTEDSLIKEQLDFVKPIYEIYEKQLRAKRIVDFNDMINFAYRGMQKVKDKTRYINYKYVIIDEYQDISIMRYNLIKKLSDLFEAKIVAVGDDWQAIFGFSGSEVGLFTNFCNLMGYGEVTKIVNTYRNSQELIDLTSEFVSKNTAQFDKSLFAKKHLKNPVEIHYYDDVSTKSEIIRNILILISKKTPNAKVLLLGRYNDDIQELYESRLFKKTSGDNLVCNEIQHANLTFLTVHSAKGLEFDEVILVNAIDAVYGFPSKVKEDSLLTVFKEEKFKENSEYAEERRLFYVALTRTKNKIYITASKKNPSQFIEEIKYHSSAIEYFSNQEIQNQ